MYATSTRSTAWRHSERGVAESAGGITLPCAAAFYDCARRRSRPTVWDVTASFSRAGVSGIATTTFTFADFDIPKPRVASVLTVADDIRLEYQFRLVRASPPTSQ